MKLTVVDTVDGDWVALYKDGIKLDEGHSLYFVHVLEKLGLKVEKRELSDDDMDKLRYYLPETISELNEELQI